MCIHNLRSRLPNHCFGLGPVWPPTQAAKIRHSGFSLDVQNLPPVCVASPPASVARGCSSSRLSAGSPGTTRACYCCTLSPRRRVATQHIREVSSGRPEKTRNGGFWRPGWAAKQALAQNSDSEDGSAGYEYTSSVTLSNAAGKLGLGGTL